MRLRIVSYQLFFFDFRLGFSANFCQSLDVATTKFLVGCSEAQGLEYLPLVESRSKSYDFGNPFLHTYLVTAPNIQRGLTKNDGAKDSKFKH